MEPQHDLAKWLAGEMTDAELSAFRNSPEYDLYERISSETARMKAPVFNEDKVLSQVLSTEKKPVKTIPIYRRFFWSVAALFVLAAGLLFLLKPAPVTMVVAENGKQNKAVLPDNSQVVLQSGSEIRFNAGDWKEKRSVSLSGEAFFKVAKGKRFDVVTDLGTVSVVGTQFNVRARGQRLEVECFEGRVSVRIKDTQRLLDAGDILVSENGIIIPADASGGSKPAWLLGELRFTQARIDAVTAELSRTYNREIEVRPPLSDRTFSGTLPAKNLEEALLLLCKTYGLKAETKLDKIVLSGE